LQESITDSGRLLPGSTMRVDLALGALRRIGAARFVHEVWITFTAAVLLLTALVSIGLTTMREMELYHVKTEFLASVSRDLKTPLSLIRGCVETLHSKRFRERAQRDEYFGIINNEILRLSAMIDRILECSNIEAGLKRYRPATVDIRDLIEDTLAYFAPALERDCFTVERQFDPSLPSARVDPGAFSDALLNLLDNAVKYSGKRRQIRVAATRAGRRIEISVSGNGPGIAPADQSRFFDGFYRGNKMSQATSGAGLGLALVKHFAIAHGGEVAPPDSPVHGSRISIFLPLYA
jgi:two-component system phosphate regulon sensor histidine kinase PhoR